MKCSRRSVLKHLAALPAASLVGLGGATSVLAGREQKKLDLLIQDGVVLTMTGRATGMISNGAVGIKGNSIVCVGDSHSIKKEYRAERVIEAKGKVIMPGMINVHTHSIGILNKGIVVDIEHLLTEGLPGYLKSFTPENKIWNVRLHLLEGIKNGMTTICDSSMDLGTLGHIHDEVGIRARLSNNIREMDWFYHDQLGEEYRFDRKYAEAAIKDTVTILERYGTNPEERISCMVCFQALDYVSRELVLEIKELARKHSAMLHIHLAQRRHEVEQVVRYYGKRPVEVLDDFGLLNSNTLAAHMTYNTFEENMKAARAGVNLAFCPTSWADEDVIPPAAEFVSVGGTVGLGTDSGTFSGVNMFDQLKVGTTLASHSAVAHAHGIPRIPAWKILRMATIEGAQAIGIDKQTGSLEPGKRADIILLDLGSLSLTPTLIEPMTNIVQNIAYSGTGNEVETVIVDGKMIMENRKVLTMDEQLVLSEAQKQAQTATEAAYKFYKNLPSSEVLEQQSFYKD